MLRDHARLRVALAVLAALATVMFLIMLIGLAHYPKKTTANGGKKFHCQQIVSPVLALELADKKEDLEEVLQTTNHAKSFADATITENADKNAVCVLRINTQQDCVFIPLYTGVLICLAWLFSYGATGKLRWLGAVGVVLALAVAVFDYVEDYKMFKALRAQQLTDGLAQAISCPSRVKWSLLGATLLFLGTMIAISRFGDLRRGAKWFLAATIGGSGVMLIVALCHLPLFVWANPAFGGALAISAAGLLGPFLRKSDRS